MNDTLPPLHGLDETAALRSIMEGTATHTGDRFFQTLVESLARVLGTHGAWVTEYLPESRRLRALAFWLGGEWVPNFEYAIDGTPCEDVVASGRLVHIADNVIALYPKDEPGREMGAVSYLGVPLLDVDSSVLGHLSVLDRRPMPAEPPRQGGYRAISRTDRRRYVSGRRPGVLEGLRVRRACAATLGVPGDARIPARVPRVRQLGRDIGPPARIRKRHAACGGSTTKAAR